MLFAYCLWREVATTYPRSTFAIEGGFHLPYFSLIEPVSSQTYDLLHSVQYPLILMVGLGFLTRISCTALLIVQGYVFFADQLNFRNHPYFFLLVLLLLIASPASEALSVDTMLQRWRQGRAKRRLVKFFGAEGSFWGSRRPLTFQRMIQVQVSLVYLFAALHKINPAFLGGAVLGNYLGGDLFEGASGRFLETMLTDRGFESLRSLVQDPSSLILASWTVVFLEFFLAFALWHHRTRPAGLLAGISFHLSIAWIMNIHVFSYAVIASYLLFLEPETIPQLRQRLSCRLQTLTQSGA